MHMLHDRKLSSIDLNLLVVLEALLSERHVTRAAARVGLSQSATSHALTRLRELYADPLLVRSGSKLELTPRAHALMPVLTRSLAELQATITREPAFDPRVSERVFRLGADDYTQAMLVPLLLAHLEEHAPGINLSIVHVPNLLQQVDEGQVDLVTVVGANIPSPLQSQKLFTEGFVCMVRKKHPSVSSKLTLPQYLGLRHLVVAPSGGPGSVVDDELAKRGKQRRVALRVSSFLVAPVLVSKSDLINTGPERLARRFATVYPLRLLPPPLPLPHFTFSIAWHPRLASDPAHVWFRQVVARILS
jgi:LysR family transcriptional regulator, transcriptional activator of nodD3 and syrA